jgi:hypothetical protein
MILLTSFTIVSLIFAFFMMLFFYAVIAAVITFVMFLFVELTKNEPTLKDNPPTNFLRVYSYTFLFFVIITILFLLIIIAIKVFSSS